MHEFGQRPRGDRLHILNSTISINSQFPEILKGGKYFTDIMSFFLFSKVFGNKNRIRDCLLYSAIWGSNSNILLSVRDA